MEADDRLARPCLGVADLEGVRVDEGFAKARGHPVFCLSHALQLFHARQHLRAK
jgi:hypothetical protein